MNIFSAILDFKNAALESRSAALFTNQFHVGEKLHLHRNRAVALAGFTPSARYVERKMSRRVPAPLRIWSIGKRFADRVKCLQVRSGIRTWRSPDRRLVHNHHVLHLVVAVEPVAELFLGAAVALRQQRLV